MIKAIDFIVDKSDNDTSAVPGAELERPHRPQSQLLRSLCNEVDTEQYDVEGDVDDEVLLIDRDKELDDRIRIIAPDQGKTPVA